MCFGGSALSAVGQRLMRDGKPVRGDAHEAELRQRVAEFEQNTLGIWIALGLNSPSSEESSQQARLRA
jgi:hypothetical protein